MALTDQTNPDSGAVDFYCSSHMSLNLILAIKEYLDNLNDDDDEKFVFQWFEKIQILSAPNEGVLFTGNVFHEVHGNFTNNDRLSVFYVFELYNKDVVVEYENDTLQEIDWKTYNLAEFDWITKRIDLLKWENKTQTKEITIDWSKQFNFIIDTIFDEEKDKEDDEEKDFK